MIQIHLYCACRAIGQYRWSDHQLYHCIVYSTNTAFTVSDQIMMATLSFNRISVYQIKFEEYMVVDFDEGFVVKSKHSYCRLRPFRYNFQTVQFWSNVYLEKCEREQPMVWAYKCNWTSRVWSFKWTLHTM